jgi:hypothetical protein
MSGTPSNAALWSDADVYYATDLSATLPADAATPFNASWHLVGLLDGAAGFESAGAFNNTKDHYGWGGMLIATTRSQWKETKKFSILEDNQWTRALVHPGSGAGSISVPTIQNVKIAFETRTGGKVYRVISRNYAQVEVDGGKYTENENDLTTIGLIATIFPDAAKVLWDEQGKPNLVSIAITPLTLALSLAGASVKPLTATATYSDATTGDVSNSVQWTSGTPAKATVDGHYVTGVATGTSSISCILGGVTATAPSVATVSA